ncbi:MAG TPA: hypothetical protein VMV78_01020 [Thiobacillus sp.]|jgi:diaminopimelate dehydrogenase|nr:hypothetical protein [Thiobacillus sp.]
MKLRPPSLTIPFLDEQTLVFAVPSVAALAKTDHGVIRERHAAPEEISHASFLLEARYDEAGLAARVMLAAARALPFLPAGAYSLLDLPPGALWDRSASCRRKRMAVSTVIFGVIKRSAK